MFPLPAARAYEKGLPLEAGSPGLGTVQSQSVEGQEQIQFVSPHPNMGQRDQYQSQSSAQAPSTSQTGHIGQDPERRSGSSTGFAGQEFRSGKADDVLPL